MLEEQTIKQANYLKRLQAQKRQRAILRKGIERMTVDPAYRGMYQSYKRSIG